MKFLTEIKNKVFGFNFENIAFYKFVFVTFLESSVSFFLERAYKTMYKRWNSILL